MNLPFQVSGRKQVILYEPHDNTRLYEAHIQEASLSYNHKAHTFLRKKLMDSTSMVMSPVDIMNPNYHRFPKFREVRAMNCTISEGDVLFMPAFWWHEVQSYPSQEQRNLAVNYWWVWAGISMKFPEYFLELLGIYSEWRAIICVALFQKGVKRNHHDISHWPRLWALVRSRPFPYPSTLWKYHNFSTGKFWLQTPWFQMSKKIYWFFSHSKPVQSTLSKQTLSKPDRKFGPLPAELHLYLCNWTLSKADTSLNRTVALVPRVSALERVDCIDKPTERRNSCYNMWQLISILVSGMSLFSPGSTLAHHASLM